MQYLPKCICLLFVLFVAFSCAPPVAPPCKDDTNCSTPTPRCFGGVCRECKGSEDCASKQCLSNGTCVPIEPSGVEPFPDVSQEPASEPVSSNGTDATESLSEPEPVAEIGPEPQPEPVPEAVCANATTRPCYPAGKIGCFADSGGKFVCKGICVVGTESCVGEIWSGRCVGATEPTAEICNGKDDDCDGIIDNGFPNIGQSCDVGQGECKTTGKFVCKSDGSGTECDAKPSTPTAEICDKKDNNCDGSVDEGCPCVLGDTQPCGSDKGECKKGTQICDINGNWGSCSGEVKPATEVCNGKDDDCNGMIDDIADLNQVCTETNRKGVCQAGVWECVNAQKVCKQTTQASSEICDGKDNDCNGLVDDNAPGCSQKCTSNTECPAAYPNCQSGQCIRFCKVHTDCDDAYWCQQGYCQNCPDGSKRSISESCNGKDDDCDGVIDNGFANLGQSCDVGQGECKATGKYVCKSDGSGTECDAKPGQSGTEACDGKDNDCNGQIDESFPEYQKACTVSNQQGECANGMYTCNQGKLVCSGPSAKTETCNGKDDDCDGQVDNRCGFLWASSAGLSLTGSPSSIAIDGSGNLYITGYYEGTAIFGTTTLTSKGSIDIFVAKLSNQGTFLWASSAGGANYDGATSIAIDSASNLYITGYYEGTAIFGTTTLTSKGSQDIFVAKLSNQGTFLWSSSAGGIKYDGATGMAIDSANNLYITGYYEGTATFGTITLNTGYGFVAKLSNQGAFLWAISADMHGYCIKIDSSDNLYITGMYKDNNSFNHVFVAKVSSQGAFLWGPSVVGQGVGSSIEIDSAGNLYVAGYYEGAAIFGTTTLNSKGRRDIFVAKLSNQGKILWISSTGSPGNDEVTSMAIDGSGNLYITGWWYIQPQPSGTLTFGTTILTSNGGDEIFVAKLNNQGAFLWASSVGGLGDDRVFGIAIDSSNDLYLTGRYNGKATFGTTILTSITPSVGQNIFVAKFR